MIRQNKIPVVFMAFFFLATVGKAEEKTPEYAKTVQALYPTLASGVLTFARLGELPQGVLLRSDNVKIRVGDVNEAIAKQPKQFQEQLKKNAFFVLEQEATGRLLLKLARQNLDKTPEETAAKDDQALINKYIERITEKVTVTDDDINLFYKENEAFFCCTPLEKIRNQIGPYVLQEKKQRVFAEYLRALGQHMTIVVSGSWVKSQAVPAKNNSLDKARQSQKPTLAVFSGRSCCGPDRMVPVLESLRKKYAKKINIVYLEAGKEQILAARYNVRSIPTQIFYDNNGNEVFRHTGLLPEKQFEEKLSEMGVK